MRWTVPGGRIFGIPVRLHLVLFLFFIGELAYATRLYGWQGLWIGAVIFAMLYFFTLLHELGHCFAGEHQGGEVEQILLWPLGGLAFIGGLPSRARPQILTSVAGPAVNLALCVIIGAVLGATGHLRQALMALPMIGYLFQGSVGPPSFAWFLVSYAFGVNLLNMLFNLLPAWPLDGGRIFVWSMQPRLGYARAAMLGTSVGLGTAVVIAILGIVYLALIPVLIAVFIALMCWQERQRLRYEAEHVDQGTFGYDFSGGYTTLESSGPGVATRARPRRPGPIRRWLDRRAARKREQAMSEELAVRRRVDELLDKINAVGMAGLSDAERAFLRDASRRFGP